MLYQQANCVQSDLPGVCRLLANVTIASGGVLPQIHAILLKKKQGKGAAAAATEEAA